MSCQSSTYNAIDAARVSRVCGRFKRLLTAIALMFAIAPVGSSPASSNEELALALVDLVQTIEESPGWSARMRGLSVDKATGVATIESLIVAAQSGGLGLRIDGARLTGYGDGDQGNFAVAELDIAHAVIATAGFEVALTDLHLDNIETPGLPAFSFNRIKPFTSLVAVLDTVAKSRISGGRVARIAVSEVFEGEKSVVSYDNVELGPLADGTLATASAGPLSLRSPADSPLASLTVARAETRGIDFDAVLHVNDPLRYLAGIGDGKWRQVVDSIKYSGIAMVMPSIRLTIESMAAEDLRVRQPPESFAPLFDAQMSRFPLPQVQIDALGERHQTSIVSVFSVGHLSLRDIAIDANGIDQLTLAGLEMTDVSGDRLGEIAIEEFVGAIAGQGAVLVGRFALGDVVMPTIDAIEAALEKAQRREDIDFSSLIPQLGFLEMADINIRALNFPGVALGRLRADLDSHVGKIPTNVVVNLENLDVAAESLPGQVKGLIAGLGYERIVVNAGFGLNWRESEEAVSLDDFHLDIADFGITTASLVLTGLTREALERSDERAVQNLLFEQASVTFDDNSVVDRSLSMRAELLNVPLERLKQQLAGALPLMLAVVGDPELVKEIVPVLQEFIKEPDKLTIEAVPDAPVPIADIGAAIRTRPQSLPGLLSISMSGPAEADPAPQPQDPTDNTSERPDASQETEDTGEATPEPVPQEALQQAIGETDEADAAEDLAESGNMPETGGATVPIPAERPERGDREAAPR